VTKFTAKTYPIGKVWGGYRIYTTTAREALLSGLHEFIAKPRDPKAAVIFTTQRLPGNQIMYGLFFLYDGEKPPPNAFGPIINVQPMINLARVQSYTSMVCLHVPNDCNGRITSNLYSSSKTTE
jgi:hypothetical protein